MAKFLSKIPLIGKISDRITLFQSNKSNTKELRLENSSLENIKGNKIDKQTIVKNYYLSLPNKKRKWDFKRFKNDIRNKKIVILDSENNFPEKELLLNYGFKNIKIVCTLDELKKQRNIWAVIYRYRPWRYYQQVEKQEIEPWIFGLPKIKTKIITIEKFKAKENLEELIDYISQLNVPLFVYSYPFKVEWNDRNILTSYYFITFANFPLMLVNHLKNILMIAEKAK